MKKSEWKSTAIILFIILCLAVVGGEYDTIKEAIPENTSDIIPSGEQVSDSIDQGRTDLADIISGGSNDT